MKYQLPFFIVFIVTWISYGCTYLLRKPIGVIKSTYSKELNLSNIQLGGLDLAMLLSYALFQMLFGSWADKFGPRKTLSICLFGSGLAMVPFSIFQQYPAFILMLFICGAFQSFCWAACNTGITHWFSDTAKRQTMLGYFGTSPFIGGIIGTIIAIIMLNAYSWKMIYILPALINIALSFVVFFGFQYPSNEMQNEQPQKYFSFLKVATCPGVVLCALAVSCLKIVRYGMYFWLPLYFEKSLNFSTTASSYLSIVFDLGAASGSLFSGIILKMFFSNNSLSGSATLSSMSAITLFLFVIIAKYTSSTLLIVSSIILISLTGMLNGIPDILLCGIVPLELASENNAGAFIGFINGLGSIGGAIEGPLIGFIADRWNWEGALIMMIICSLIASICCIRAAWVIKSFKAKQPEEENIQVLTKIVD